MAVRCWPLRGSVQQFYSGGFGSSEEDCKRLLRQIARWAENELDGRLIESVTVYPYSDGADNPMVDEPTTWAAQVFLVGGE